MNRLITGLRFFVSNSIVLCQLRATMPLTQAALQSSSGRSKKAPMNTPPTHSHPHTHPSSHPSPHATDLIPKRKSLHYVLPTGSRVVALAHAKVPGPRKFYCGAAVSPEWFVSRRFDWVRTHSSVLTPSSYILTTC